MTTTLTKVTILYQTVWKCCLALLGLAGLSLHPALAQDGIRYSIKLLPDGVTYLVSLKPTVSIPEGFQQGTNSAQITILANPNALSITTGSNFTALNGTSWNIQTVRNPSVPTTPGSSTTMLAGRDYFLIGLTNNGVEIPYTQNVETPLFQFKNLLTCAGPLSIWESNDPFLPNPPVQPINVGNDLTVYGIDFASSNVWLGNYDLGQADCSVPVSNTALPTVALITPTTNSTIAGPTVFVSGTATPGSNVTVGENGTVLCSTTASAGGSFSCSIPLNDGPHTLTALAQNANGPSAPTSPTVFTVNTPIVPVPPTLAIISPTNGGTTPSSPVVSGTATPNSTVVLTGPGPATICSTTASLAGNWSCTLNAAAPGPQAVTAIAYKDGLPSVSSAVSFTTVALPTISLISPANNTTQPIGTSVVSGTATPNALVTVSDGAGALCSVSATATGAWSCSGLTFSVGPQTLTAVAQHAGGSSIPAVSNFTLVAPTSPGNSTCLVEYKIALRPDGKTYRVTMRTNINFNGPNDIVNSAQVTVIAPHGSLRPLSVTSITGTWAFNTTVVAPAESPGYDYFVFGLTSNGTSMPFVNGQETPLFDFVTAGNCSGGLALMEVNDPFRVPNSLSLNVGNEITVFGYQVDADNNGLWDNAWCGNYGLGQAACQSQPTVAITTPRNTTTSTTPLVSGTATPGAIIDLTGPAGTTFCSTTATLSGEWSCTITVPAGPNSLTATAKTTSGTATANTNFTATDCSSNTLLVSPGSATLCPGTSLTLTAFSQSTTPFSWSGVGLGQTTGQQVSLSLATTGTYRYTVVQTIAGCGVVSATVSVVSSTAVCRYPPVAIDDIAATPMNTPVSGNVLTNDDDPANRPLAVSQTLVSLPASGTVNLNTDGTYTYTPASNVTGTVEFTYRACNDYLLCDEAVVRIQLIPPVQPGQNSPPIANDDNAKTFGTRPITIVVVANDSDPDGANTVGKPTLASLPTNGTAVVNPDGTVGYTAATGFVGKDVFSYSVCDTGSPQLCDVALVTVRVMQSLPAGSNLPPIALDDAYLTTANTSVTGNMATNDVEFDGQPLSYTVVDGPTNGTVVPAGTGSFIYIPKPNFTGNDAFVYRVCDTDAPALCDTATVYLIVLPKQGNTVSLRVKMLLQGALLDPHSPSSLMNDGLMRDDLRSQGFIPATEPYTGIGGTRFAHQGGGGGETMPAGVSAITGPNAIVDWIFVELRDPSNLSLVVATKSALVQRDGDVVLASDGTSPLSFSGLASSSFYISVKHRNHLGVMTANSVPLSVTGTVVDFTTMTYADLWNNSPQYDGYEMVDLDGKKALWAGNSLSDQLEASPAGKDRVKYQGPNNDLLKVFNEVMNPSLNTGQNYNFDLGYGYYFGDVNLDGKVKYQGPKNDSNIIFMNVVDKYLLNGSKLYNYDLIREQLP